MTAVSNDDYLQRQLAAVAARTGVVHSPVVADSGDVSSAGNFHHSAASGNAQHLMSEAALRRGAPQDFSLASVDDAMSVVRSAPALKATMRPGYSDAEKRVRRALRDSPMDDGERAARYSLTLLERTVPTSHEVDAAYATALLTAESAGTVSEAIVAAEVASVAADADGFCFAERVGVILRAASLDARLALACGVSVQAAVGLAHRLPWFAGFGRLVVPLCLLYPTDAEVYLVFRQMHVAVWSRFHTPSLMVRGGGLQESVSVAMELVVDKAPQVVDHCISLGAPLDRFVCSWVLSGFSGYLPVSQVLALWDVVFREPDAACMTFGVVASTVIRQRAENIMAATERPALTDLLSDLGDFDLGELFAGRQPE